jgi:hypothetical protein
MSDESTAVLMPPTKLDYSLTGENAAKAIERGLAEADWYQSPVPRPLMRKLLERRDGPAIRDTIIWFGLIIGLPDLSTLAIVVGDSSLSRLRSPLRFYLGFPMARGWPWHRFQDGLDEQRALRNRLFHGDA